MEDIEVRHMKINKKLYSVALVSIALFLFLIFVSSAASASQRITETRITTSGSAAYPDIYGNKIVWQDSRNGNNFHIPKHIRQEANLKGQSYRLKYIPEGSTLKLKRVE
jgi:beta propeller repeat protein